jgi:hypothetical protein
MIDRAPTTRYRLVAVVPKNSCTEFRIRLLDDGKHRKIDFRIYRCTGTGMVSTEKGAEIMLDKVPAIITALQEALRAFDHGLIEPEAGR